MTRLLLFDVDGTLVDTGGAGRRAFEITFEAAFGIGDAFRGIPFSGRTDPWIFEAGARAAFGRAPTADEVLAFFDRYPAVLADEVASSPGYRACPGIEVLLEGLSARGDCLLGLCTGNLEQGARQKLSRLGLDRFFAFGGFASDSPDRAELTRVSLERGRALAGGPADAVVIGDSVWDAAAARANGLPVVLVATGRTTLDELAREDPRVLLPSFEDWGVSVARLLGLGEDLRAGTEDVGRAAAIVRAGGVLVHPTDTLYGLAGNAMDPGAAARVRRIKGGRGAPFLVLVADAEAAFALSAGTTDAARRLAAAFWPGPVTLVLAAAPGLPGHLVGPEGTVAVRVDAHPFARALVAAARTPVLSTSANRTGQPAPASADALDGRVGAACDLVVTQPGTLAGRPSTLVRVDGDRVEVLRQGAVPEDAIRRAAAG